MWEGETVVRRCDSSQGGVKVVRNWFQLMERYDGRGACGRIDCQVSFPRQSPSTDCSWATI